MRFVCIDCFDFVEECGHTEKENFYVDIDMEQKQHPEDKIYHVKQFINNLQTVEQEKFDALSNELHMNKRGDDFLFDYIFNSGQDTKESFGEYLEGFGTTIEEMTL